MPTPTLDQLQKNLELLEGHPESRADAFAIEAVKEALDAAREGNFGVGAVLVLGNAIVERGHNRVFAPRFRSDLHAEMDVLTRFEDRHPSWEGLHGLTLYSSLEPCPMCTVRLINAGLNFVYYASSDQAGGMLNRFESLPPEFRELAAGRTFALAGCSMALRELAWQVFAVTVEEGDRRLQMRGTLLS